MGINRKFDYLVLDLIESAAKNVKALPLNLGGLSGAGGGIGAPPGGYIGQLPQRRVAYDESEDATLFTPLSGMSLVDNLNHIRYRIEELEGAPSGTFIVDDYDGVPTITDVIHVTFSGAIVSQLSPGHALVAFTGGGGSSFTGDANSVVLTDGAGALDTMPWLKWGTSTEEYIEFGADEVGKEANAGKMGYETFGANYLWIVGAGINAGDRWVKILDNLEVGDLLRTPGLTLTNLTSAIILATDSNGNIIDGTSGATETIQEVVGQMVASNVETGISVTYDDPNGKLDFSVTPAGVGAVPNDGWIAGTVTWTYTSADSPIFVMSIPDAQAALLTVGNKIKLTQTTTKYFIIHAKGTPSGGNTPVTIFGGTDYTLANAAITSPFWSTAHSPTGFPMDDDKWTVEASNTANAHKVPAGSTAWFGGANLTNTGISIDVPIGAWKGYAKSVLQADDTTVTDFNCYITFSNANNTESDTDNTGFIALTAPSGTYKIWQVISLMLKVTVATKTTHYLNIKTTVTTADDIHMRGDVVPTIIKLVSNYL